MVGRDREEFDSLVTEEIPHLRRYATALVGDRVHADDLVQDCLERALRKWRLWGTHGRLRGWLFRMLYRTYLNQRRRRLPSQGRSLEDNEAEMTAAAGQHTQAEARETIAALERLPEGQRSAILLLALEDISYEEAAWVLDVPVGTLRSRVSRGRETLRQYTNAPEAAKASLRSVK